MSQCSTGPTQAEIDARDYAKEMREVIDTMTSGKDYVPRAVAAKITEMLMARDQDLLFGWLECQAEYLVWLAITKRDRSHRSYARRRAGSVSFAQALEAHDDGDDKPLRGFFRTRFALEDGSHKRLVDLKANDLHYVAKGYEHRARENSMNAAFLRVLADKVGVRSVGEMYTEQQLNVLWLSLNPVF